MNTIPIAFCFDDNFSLPAWVSIKSLVASAIKEQFIPFMCCMTI